MFAQDGPLAAFTTFASATQVVQLANLETGAITDIARTHGHEQVLGLDVSGTKVAWETGAWAHHTNATPCAFTGALDWTIYVYDVADGSQRKVASGTNSDEPYCGALITPMAIDGDLLGYVVEDPRPGAPHATTITVQSMTTGTVARTIKSDVIVADLDLSGEDVAYVEGKPNPSPYGPVDPTWLMFWPAAQAEPTRLSSSVDYISLAGGRLAWNEANQFYPDRYLTVTAQAQAPVAMAEQMSYSWSAPISSGRLVTFANDDGVNIWNADTSQLTTLWPYPDYAHPGVAAPYADLDQASARGGWLVWSGSIVTADTAVGHIDGLPLAELPVAQ